MKHTTGTESVIFISHFKQKDFFKSRNPQNVMSHHCPRCNCNCVWSIGKTSNAYLRDAKHIIPWKRTKMIDAKSVKFYTINVCFFKNNSKVRVTIYRILWSLVNLGFTKFLRKGTILALALWKAITDRKKVFHHLPS